MSEFYLEEELKSKINRVVVSNLSNPDLKGDLIAKQLMVNRMFLHRKIKIFYNSNARDFILNKRINFAKKQLINTNLSIHAIAYKVGYHDVSYFSKTFKKITGCSPSEYRKNGY
jgi:YesN/AraC family two-component response regulator